MTATDSTLTNNTASDSGGAIDAGTVAATGSTFTGNTANSGGAIDAGGLVEVTGSTFTGNIATSSGGAIFNLGPVRVTVTATDSTFTGNTATLGGGAILSDNVSLLYATVVENTALNGANLYGSSLVSFGSVVAGHPVNSTNCDSFLSFASSGYNYSDDSSCGFSDSTDVQNGSDPLLSDLGSYGGPTQTRPPQAGSPLVDAIPFGACDPVVVTDQLGRPRPAFTGCDIGAVELQPAPPPPPPPPPPPLPPEICQNQSVTVDLARGQSPTNGPDVIRGTTGADIINALAGDDIVCALGGDDIVSGNQGQDRMFGAGGDDEMRGNAGDDILRGRAGDDLLYGQAGNDTLGGGADTDTCRGGTGIDTATACETTVGVP